MAKFINKKEQVFDLRLTSYGHYLFSIGSFKPFYYAFFDDNVAYDRRYFVSASSEPQNDIHTRIKDNTQYLESLTLFQDLETLTPGSGTPEGISQRTEDGNFFRIDVTPTKMIPRKDIFNNDLAIGDARIDGATQEAPAWKLAALQGEIKSSTEKYICTSTGSDAHPDALIPQVNLNLDYVLKTIPQEFVYDENFDPSSIRQAESVTSVFADGRVIKFESDDALVYLEEVNTETLTENYDIEVFLVTSSATPEEQAAGQYGADVLLRKYFQKEIPQIKDGFMIAESPISNSQTNITTASVEYYFDILVDSAVNQDLACKGSQLFNRQSYYVDLDFECDKSEDEDIYYDIYGKATEPEICQN